VLKVPLRPSVAHNMPGFSQAIAQKRLPEETEEKTAEVVQKAFLVDDSKLQCGKTGIKYRFSPVLRDKKGGKKPPSLKLVGPRSLDASSIRDGTKVIVKEYGTMVFESVNSDHVITRLKQGQELTAAGPVEVVDTFEMLPIRPFGERPFPCAVQLELVELELEYYKIHHTPVAEFGTTVYGVEHGDGWVKVGSLYLPKQFGDVPVLREAWWEGIEDKEEKEREREQRRYKEKRIKDEEEKKEQGRTVPFDVSCVTPGIGSLYEVVSDKAIIRRRPSVDAELDNIIKKGSVVELFSWDDSWKWRRCCDNTTTRPITGWMLLDHPERGALLRPKNFPAKPWASRPLQPTVAAVFDNDTPTLKTLLSNGADANFKVDGGPPLLTLAIELGHMDCCVHLMAAGATVEAKPQVTGLVSDETMEASLRHALLRALAGAKDFDIDAFDKAVQLLQPDSQSVAERLFEEIAARLAEKQKEDEVEEEVQYVVTEDWEEDKMQFWTKENPVWQDCVEEPAAEPEEVPPIQPELYEVVHKAVWIRQEPNPKGGQIGMRKKGQKVYLFEYDETEKWRRCNTGGADADLNMHEPVGIGWMLLSHEQIGDLLRPV